MVLARSLLAFVVLLLVERVNSINHEPVSSPDRLSSKSGLPDVRPAPNVSMANAAAAGYLLSSARDTQLDLKDPIDRHLWDILNRNGPDMRPSRDYKDFKDVPVNVSMRAWWLLHDYAKMAISNKIYYAWPAIEEVLASARVSNKCQKAVQSTMDGANRMESWAIKVLNSWGSFPMSGIYEGTYGDVGAFHTCVGIKGNIHIDHAHYCSMTFRPVMPTPREYELVVRREPKQLRFMFERDMTSKDDNQHPNNNTNNRHLPDAFTDILNHAQYHHFLAYKIGTCWPIDCTPFDVKRVARILGRRNILSNGPVKCYSKNKDDYEQPDNIDALKSDNSSMAIKPTKKLVISVWDKNDGIFIWKPHFDLGHKIALSIFVVITAFVLVMTLIDFLLNKLPCLSHKLSLAIRNLPFEDSQRHWPSAKAAVNHDNRHVEFVNPNQVRFNRHTTRVGFSVISTTEGVDGANDHVHPSDDQPPISTFMSIVEDYSIFTSASQFFRITEGQMKNDILCLNGIRCITMFWSIMTHTFMYNDWAGFARTREIEKSLDDLLMQPFFNGAYLVDTFFLMSGLLSALTTFKQCQGLRAQFSTLSYIIGRWLRLTPQVLFTSMIYIFFPALSIGPHWFPIVGEYSENCINNWWINMFHAQAFYKREEMCNFVTWWVSIDFFYHTCALAIIWVFILLGHRSGLFTISGLVAAGVTWQCLTHYNMSFPPNVFSTIPQVGAMWTEFTLNFFWTPYAHVFPFLLGFYIGYLMALKKKLILNQLNYRRSLIGWTLAVSLLIGQSYGTYWWITGRADYSRLVSTIYNAVCPLIWSSSLCWIIIACQHGYGGFVNQILSCKFFLVIGKASYLVYLSHFMVLFVYYGNLSLLLEPSPVVMIYIIIGNIFVSTLLGMFLSIVYEIPWLKTHRRLMKYI